MAWKMNIWAVTFKKRENWLEYPKHL